MKKTTKSKYTLKQRLQILQEYEDSELSADDLGKMYGIRGNTLAVWRMRLRNSGKNRIFASGSEPIVADEMPMKEKSKAELEAELAQVKKDLEWAKLQNLALNTMIDIAEEQGIRIRKKSGAKQ